MAALTTPLRTTPAKHHSKGRVARYGVGQESGARFAAQHRPANPPIQGRPVEVDEHARDREVMAS
jgi:hypothetical protein